MLTQLAVSVSKKRNQNPMLKCYPQALHPVTQKNNLRDHAILIQSPSSGASSIENTSLKHSKTLITGATGFIGGACAISAMQDGRAADLLFLVRAGTIEEGMKRIIDSLTRFEPPPPLLKQLTPRQIVLGDLANVDTFANDPRLNHVTHVLNCAAVASFGDHPGIWPVNVLGTVKFAERMSKVATLKRFIHIGTAMACGPGKVSPVSECWELDDDVQHLVRYTASKAEAERQMHAIPGLPLVVARPSIVVGHTQLGCKPSTSIFWVFRMVHDLGCFMCDLDEAVDVIPVDYCARALMHLLFKEKISSNLYHISAGENSATFRDIELALANARGIPSKADTFRKITEQEISSLASDFKTRLGITNRRLMVKALKLYGGFAVLNYQFDNRRLIDEGLEPPPPFPSYIDHCINSTNGLPLIEQMMDDFK